MGLYTYFNAEITRAYMSNVSAGLSFTTKRFVKIVKESVLFPDKQHEPSEDGWENYKILWDGCIVDYFTDISAKKEEHHQDGHSDGYIIRILASKKAPYCEGMFSEYIKLCELLGGCSYRIYSEHDEDLNIQQKFEKFKSVEQYENAHFEYEFGCSKRNVFGFSESRGFKHLLEASIDANTILPVENLQQIYEFVDEWVEECREYHRSISRWNDPIRETMPKIREVDYLGVKTNVFFFLIFLRNRYQMRSLDDYKQITNEQLKEYANFLTEIFGETDNRKFYSWGVKPFATKMQKRLVA